MINEHLAADTGATGTIAKYIQELSFDHVPAEVTEQAKYVILDSLGCQIAANRLENGKLIVQFVRSLGDRGEATVVGTDHKASVINAALANGTLAHGDELDESMEFFGHTQAVIVPTVMAVGEKEGSSGKDVITATVVGYDIARRLGLSLLNTSMLASTSFTTHAICGPLCSATAASRLLKLDNAKTTVALGLAGDHASGLRAWRTEAEHMSKSLQLGVAARNGITAAYLARLGFGGPLSILEGPFSFFQAFGGQCDSAELTKDLGQRFDIMATCFKKYACGHPIHAPIDGMFKIMEEQKLEPRDIKVLTVRLPTSAKELVGDAPTLSINVQYTLAVAAFDRQVRWEQYTEERQRDHAVQELKRRIRITADSELDEIEKATGAHPGIVEIETLDGKRFIAKEVYPKGDPQNPMSRRELEEKFMYQAMRILSRATAGQIVDAVLNLEALDDVSKLGDLVRVT